MLVGIKSKPKLVTKKLYGGFCLSLLSSILIGGSCIFDLLYRGLKERDGQYRAF